MEVKGSLDILHDAQIPPEQTSSREQAETTALSHLTSESSTFPAADQIQENEH